MDSTNSNAISIVDAFDSNENNLTSLNDKSLEDKQDLYKSQARSTRSKLINSSSASNVRTSSKESQGYKKRKSNEFIEAKNKTYSSKKSNTDENKFISVRHELINADNNRQIDLWRVKLNKKNGRHKIYRCLLSEDKNFNHKYKRTKKNNQISSEQFNRHLKLVLKRNSSKKKLFLQLKH